MLDVCGNTGPNFTHYAACSHSLGYAIASGTVSIPPAMDPRSIGEKKWKRGHPSRNTVGLLFQPTGETDILKVYCLKYVVFIESDEEFEDIKRIRGLLSFMIVVTNIVYICGG